MDTIKISNAQLNVSKHYTVGTIDKLIGRFGKHNYIAYYNIETKSIDIEVGDNNINIGLIKTEIKEWLNELPADQESIDIMCDNIDFIFNITQINPEDGIIIKVYLY